MAPLHCQRDGGRAVIQAMWDLEGSVHRDSIPEMATRLAQVRLVTRFVA